MKKKILSIFVDESGDFGAYCPQAPYYLVSLVLHDQSISVDENIAILEEHLSNLGYSKHSVHTGPLIRRESIYESESILSRKRLFNAIFNFARKCPVKYLLIAINKKECSDVIDLISKMSKKLAEEINIHEQLFRSYDEIVVYYDNGQVELTRILSSVLPLILRNVLFKKVLCSEKKLSQVADLLCTMELIEIKRNECGLSISENNFFSNGRDFKKNYLKPLRALRLSK